MMHNTDIATDSAETAALVVDGPQPVWMTLNQAREQAFTGEIVFETDPEVLAYLDDGIVYYAERAADAPLGQRLLDAGVVDATQLERGMVRIGDLEHLGRLFDRDPSVDRDAVIVTAELFTEELIAEIANQAIADVRVTAYRHHPSGVHRWFVAPLDQASVTRPMDVIGQLDGTVIDDLPSLPYGLEEDELMIEWDVIVDSDSDSGLVSVRPHDATPSVEDVSVDDVSVEDVSVDEEPDATVFELSLDLAEFVDQADDAADVPSWTAETLDELAETAEVVDEDELELPDFELAHLDFDDIVTPDSEMSGPDASTDIVEAVDQSGDFEFSVVWPDGSEQPADVTVVDLDEPIEVEPTFTETDDGELQFSMPPLTLSDEPEAADADVPDDVADAVRRAIAAIESASVGDADEVPEAVTPGIDVTEIEVTEIEVTEIEVTEIESRDRVRRHRGPRGRDRRRHRRRACHRRNAGTERRVLRVRSADDGDASGGPLRADVRRRCDGRWCANLAVSVPRRACADLERCVDRGARGRLG